MLSDHYQVLYLRLAKVVLRLEKQRKDLIAYTVYQVKFLILISLVVMLRKKHLLI